MVRVGIDVGGTGIQVGVLDEQMNILAEGSIPTSTTIPFAEQITLITECVLSTVASAGLDADQIESVGVGIPGIANKETGEVVKCPNMGWNHVPFRSEFKKHLNVPIFIDNDANVAALAESVAGVSAGTSSSVFITIGTGIGSGIIINGKIWNGFHGIGGELGHVIFDLNGGMLAGTAGPIMVKGEIGKAFAEHCRHEGEEKYIHYGKRIYEVVTEEVQKQITLMEFAD